jgi:hypothetical protein
MDPKDVEAVSHRIAGADRLLIVAAAGLSISVDAPNNPYHSTDDFTLHYPQVGHLTQSTLSTHQNNPQTACNLTCALSSRGEATATDFKQWA